MTTFDEMMRKIFNNIRPGLGDATVGVDQEAMEKARELIKEFSEDLQFMSHTLMHEVGKLSDIEGWRVLVKKWYDYGLNGSLSVVNKIEVLKTGSMAMKQFCKEARGKVEVGKQRLKMLYSMGNDLERTRENQGFYLAGLMALQAEPFDFMMFAFLETVV